ncbi:ABC-F family ATP-binding cassette domain-containing protein [Halobacteriovorax sp. JY17]|uniref:ABC-F family ATP-binding cassette domain-containing protein n=1 Tax=Halobacteriovorax sp. JY17 TaxID=2014617 RepID=UPI000C449256|nr:ABC-F family ATP-binding cassette domain-containing protein [Halobacteriovorax sp. JY17]PIK13561.1 MAG: ABC transporter ATP-binding protein [Halobacteriovorax sp. JY17]
MIQLNGISKHFGLQVLFENLDLLIGKRERIGFVGRNGSGKSTLFKIILGEITPDGGEVVIPKGYKIGALDQHINFTKPTVLEECCQVLSEEEQYDWWKAEKILFGLGFSEEDLDRDPNSFSGGYQVRINLTKALVQNPNLLLLDEPTNYLDIVSLRWLRGFLKSFKGEVLLITHDKDFMDSVSTHTIGLSRKRLSKYEGNTTKFYEQLSIADEIYEQTRLNQEKKKKELQGFVDRFGAKASKATQAQSRAKQIEKMGTIEKLASENTLGFTFHHKDCPGKVILEASDLSFSYSGVEEEDLFKSLSLNVGREDRIGIIGKNGKGKSTLLNVIAGELTPRTGNIKNHPSLSMGHFGQTNIERLDPNSTIITEISDSNHDLGIGQVRQICGTMMFTDDLAKKKVSVLSGGEKSRVMLGKILAKKSNLLLLDEPTNHLDMESIETLSEEIVKFPGAVILVTHSELLLRSSVNKLIIFHQGRAEFFDGTYDEFLEKIGWETEEA